MELDCQETLFGHRIQIAVQTIDHHHFHLLLVDGSANAMCKFARRQFGRIDFVHPRGAVLQMFAQIDSQA